MLRLNRREFTRVALATACSGRLLRAAEPEPRTLSWLKEVQRAPDKLPDDAPQLSPLLATADGQPISTLESWKVRRDELRRAWLDFLGPLQHEHQPIQLKILEEDHAAGCLRQLVQYESEPGLRVEGYLLRPLKLVDRAPGVVVLHSTVDFNIRQPAGLEGDEQDFIGLKLARKGMVAFCPRCFLWQGEGGYQRLAEDFLARAPGSKGMAKMLWDAQRAVDLLQSLPEVDPGRIGAVGHSLGGKESLYLGAFDDRVGVIVSSEGGIGTRFSNWEASWYLGETIQEPGFPREHHELLALTAPRPFLLLGGDSADGDRSWPFIEAALGVYELYGETPRIGLFNHHQGHSIPPDAESRLYEWFETWL